MMQSVRFGVGATLVTAAILLALALPTTIAQAQEADTAETSGGPDGDAIVMQTQRYVAALVTADLNNDGVADFDASGDGIAELPLSNFADLEVLPGSDDFTELISATFELGVSSAPNGTSLGSTCGGMALSFDTNGNLVDWALGAGATHGGGPDGTIIDLFPQAATGSSIFTEDNPFVIGERVVVIGQLVDTETDAVPDAVAAWTATSAGVKLADGSVSTLGDRITVNEVRITDHSIAGVVNPVGVFPLDTSIATADVLCQTSGWVQFDQGTPLLTNVGIAASGLSLLGALGLFYNARPARAWKTEEKA